MKLSEVRRITEEMSSIAQADRENAMQTLLQNMGIAKTSSVIRISGLSACVLL